MREVASKTNDLAGDGTTTATVLAQAIVKEGAKSVAAGMNPMDLKRGIDLVVDAIVADLKSHAKKVTSNDEIPQVGTISANGDTEIGRFNFVIRSRPTYRPASGFGPRQPDLSGFPQASELSCLRARADLLNIAGGFSKLRISLPNITTASPGWSGSPKPNCSISSPERCAHSLVDQTQPDNQQG